MVGGCLNNKSRKKQYLSSGINQRLTFNWQGISGVYYYYAITGWQVIQWLGHAALEKGAFRAREKYVRVCMYMYKQNREPQGVETVEAVAAHGVIKKSLQ